MGDADTRELVRQILDHEAVLPSRLRSDILERGAEAVEPLLDILRDESLADTAAPGGGYAPIHAAELLVRLGASAAVVPMVRRLMRTDPGEVLHDTLLRAAEELGPAVAPAALEALAEARNPDERFGLLSVLSHCGVKDERIYSALLEQLQEDPIQGALNLARYGDPRALEPLKRALDACPVDEDTVDLFADQAVVELKIAIEKLGGTLDAAQGEKVERARRTLHWLARLFQWILDTLPPPPMKRGRRPGRNDPCWCGSGMKYKKCHLGSDSR